jgi:uncharacterized membrane protein YebE (DUF533 family)
VAGLHRGAAVPIGVRVELQQRGSLTGGRSGPTIADKGTTMNIGDLFGSVLQSGFGPSSRSRMENMLDQAGRLVGGRQNLAVGGIGALAGALMGSGRGLGGAIRGGIGGGAVTMLGLVAWQALKKSGAFPGQGGPPAFREPQTDAERAELEQQSELLLKAMINAAKADGRIDESEMGRILGKVQGAGGDRAGLDFLRAEMARPMDTDGIVAAAKGRPELPAQVYAASLLAIEVDTPAEKGYLEQLASALGLAPEVREQLHQSAGL